MGTFSPASTPLVALGSRWLLLDPDGPIDGWGRSHTLSRFQLPSCLIRRDGPVQCLGSFLGLTEAAIVGVEAHVMGLVDDWV